MIVRYGFESETKSSVDLLCGFGSSTVADIKNVSP
jgi:hypothetical protein